jgi:hypothetical protein
MVGHSSDPVEGVRKIKKAGFCGDTEKSQSSSYFNPFAPRCSHAVPVIHQQ